MNIYNDYSEIYLDICVKTDAIPDFSLLLENEWLKFYQCVIVLLDMIGKIGFYFLNQWLKPKTILKLKSPEKS